MFPIFFECDECGDRVKITEADADMWGESIEDPQKRAARAAEFKYDWCIPLGFSKELCGPCAAHGVQLDIGDDPDDFAAGGALAMA